MATFCLVRPMYVQVRTLCMNHARAMRNLWMKWWTTPFVVSKEGLIHYVDDVTGLVAEEKGTIVGVATYVITNAECEIMSFNSCKEGVGVATRLLRQLEDVVKDNGCRRIWVITTNDNIDALSFYQKRGYRLVAIYRDAMNDVRKLKPELPVLGKQDIRLRYMIELEKILLG